MVKQSEVQRIMAELTRADTAGEELLRRFRSASRGDVKLACAIRGYFAEGNEEYLPYLRSRIRPAVMELVRSGSIRELSMLAQQGMLPPQLAEEALETAISAQVPASIVWLLKWKAEHIGFCSQELSL